MANIIIYEHGEGIKIQASMHTSYSGEYDFGKIRITIGKEEIDIFPDDQTFVDLCKQHNFVIEDKTAK